MHDEQFSLPAGKLRSAVLYRRQQLHHLAVPHVPTLCSSSPPTPRSPQCDRCECWVHQICGLFNKGRNDEDRGYLCPHCLLEGLTTGERKVPAERPQAMLSAKDLPRCELSDHLEKRLEAALAVRRSWFPLFFWVGPCKALQCRASLFMFVGAALAVR